MRAHPAREYILTVFRLWKTHVSGWILAVVAIASVIAAAIVSDDAGRSALVVRATALITSVAAIAVILVAQYDAWKEERAAHEKSKKALEAAIADGPDVQLSVSKDNNNFYVQAVNGRNVIKISLDAIETLRYKIQTKELSSLVAGLPPSALQSTLEVKDQNLHYVDMDLALVLADSSKDWQCSLETVLRYSTSFGLRFQRRISIKSHRLHLWTGGIEIANHEIQLLPKFQT
jgi:hypothetical protein